MRNRLVLLVLLLLLCGCSKIAKRVAREVLKAKHAREITDAGEIPSVVLGESYHSPNGLITAHYPADFAAKVAGKAAIMMARNLDDDESELITLVSVVEPVSTDLTEYTRAVSLAEVKKLDGYQQISKTTTKCLGVDWSRNRLDVETRQGDLPPALVRFPSQRSRLCVCLHAPRGLGRERRASAQVHRRCDSFDQ